MIYALNKYNYKILAHPGSKAKCPSCKEELIPKCGEIKIWHWSHKADKDCDSWGEGETKWHLNWKSLVSKEDCEVEIEKTEEFNDGTYFSKKHRADIFINNQIIELQNSPISPEEIKEREQFYKNMIWIINIEEFKHNFVFRKKEKYITFRWKSPRKSLWSIKKPLFLDYGKPTEYNLLCNPKFPNLNLNQEYLFFIKKIYNQVPCGGWGYFISRQQFIKTYLESKI